MGHSNSDAGEQQDADAALEEPQQKSERRPALLGRARSVGRRSRRARPTHQRLRERRLRGQMAARLRGGPRVDGGAARIVEQPVCAGHFGQLAARNAHQDGHSPLRPAFIHQPAAPELQPR